MMHSRTTSACALLMLATTVACAKRQPAAQPMPQQSAPPSSAPSAPPAAAANPGDAEAAAALQRMRMVLEQTVLFDYDDSSLRADAQEVLAAKVPYLRENNSIELLVEGHADERGSIEYNLALGLRRANAVRDYLTGFGLSTSRFETATLGEDQPVARGADERAWAQNRRAEFRVNRGMPSAGR